MSTQTMTDDRTLTFAEIDTWANGTRGRLCEHIESAQAHILSRTLTRKWISKLKVLVPAPPTETAFDYQLVAHSTIADSRYIAVSYCWRSSRKVSDPDLLRPIRIKQGDNIRTARARPQVIHRAFRYALAVGIGSVWIDQECIEQDDRADKEAGIQSMDLVYRNAHCALGLLEECCVEDLDDVESLRKAMTESLTKIAMGFETYSLINSALLVKLMKDKWFTRAWISQEFQCASTIVLLVAWDKQMAQEEWSNAESLSPQREDDRRTGCLDGGISEPEVLGIITQDGARSDMFLRRANAPSDAFQLLKLDDSNSTSSTTSFKIHTAYVCKVLDAKINSRVADRLAMISNISDHKWGLDVYSVEKKGLSFSACALALSLVNGDASLIMRDEINLERDFSGWLPPWDSTIQDIKDLLNDIAKIESRESFTLEEWAKSDLNVYIR
ncbi:hypothetical protein IFR05_006758 [Cadophora sp. M221]|nr:hypothetical protein IFR05_006758 [Cadophora sp. M221]